MGQTYDRSIADEVYDERVRAHLKHGRHSMEGGDIFNVGVHSRKVRILLEEVGEAAKEVNDMELGSVTRTSLTRLRTELVQCGAMVEAWIAAIDGDGLR